MPSCSPRAASTRACTCLAIQELKHDRTSSARPCEPLSRCRRSPTCPRTSAARSSRCRRRPASCPTSSSPSPTGPAEFRAFFAYHDALLLRESGLTKGEKEMIIVATSGANQCLYCVVAHGALLRIYEKKPLVADQVAVNYRKADITRAPDARCSTSR